MLTCRSLLDLMCKQLISSLTRWKTLIFTRSLAHSINKNTPVLFLAHNTCISVQPMNWGGGEEAKRMLKTTQGWVWISSRAGLIASINHWQLFICWIYNLTFKIYTFNMGMVCGLDDLWQTDVHYSRPNALAGHFGQDKTTFTYCICKKCLKL